MTPRIAPRRRRGRPLRIGAVIVGLIGLVAVVGSVIGGERDCDLGYRPSFDDAATDRTVVAVVEREVIADSVLPWGSSLAVTTRVWGERRVDRWAVTERAFVDCTFAQSRPVGATVYDFEARGGITPPYLHWFDRDNPVEEATSAAWADRFGSVRSFETTTTDRVVAWLRVYPELLVLLPVAGLIGWVRRREGESRLR